MARGNLVRHAADPRGFNGQRLWQIFAIIDFLAHHFRAPFRPCHDTNKTFMKLFIEFLDRGQYDGTGSKGRWDISKIPLDNLLRSRRDLSRRFDLLHKISLCTPYAFNSEVLLKVYLSFSYHILILRANCCLIFIKYKEITIL